MRGLGHLRLIQQEVHPQILRRLHTGHGFGRRHSGSVHELLCLAQNAVGFMVTIETPAGRTIDLSQGQTALELGRFHRSPFPFSLENGLVEIVHEEGCLSSEAGLSFRVIRTKDEVVPLSLLEQPRRNLVPMITIHPIPILRWELTTPTD